MPRGASITAEAVCYFRALETARPAPRRVLEDPFAVHFLGRSWRRALENPVIAGLTASRSPLNDQVMDALVGLGSYGLQRFVAARHRFIDDALIDFLARGGEQVVILGAGFDARALRFGELLSGRPLFEVDFPATQARKQRRLERAIAARHIPAELTGALSFIPIDFEHQTLEQGLCAGAFRSGLKTFYAWEGVSMYLSPATVELTLGTLARLSAPGSELALDLWSPSRSNSPLALARRLGASTLSLIGEPLRFSLSTSKAPTFFQRLGYHTTDLLDAGQLARRYGLVERAVFPDISVARLALG